MARLPEFGNRAVVTDEERPAGLPVAGVLPVLGHVAFVHAAVVVGEDRRDVQPVGAGHAVLALGAGHGGVFEHQLRGIFEQRQFLAGAGFERRIGADIVLKVLHVGHAAQHGQHSGPGTRVAEGPRSGALGRTALLEPFDQMVVQPRKAPAEQRLHDHGRDAALLQLAVEIFGIDVSVRSMLPVDVVHLDLDEIPPRFTAVVHGQQVVEDLLIAVERPPEVADAPGLALAQQKVEHAAVDKTFVESLDALVAAHSVQQIVIQIIRLQVAKRPPVHLLRILEYPSGRHSPPCHTVIGHLRGDEHLLARMAFEGDTRRFFGKALYVDGGRVEIVDPVGDGIIDQLVDGLLVDRVAVGRRRLQQGPAHAAVAQQRHAVARREAGPEGHPIGRDLTRGGSARRRTFRLTAVKPGRCGGRADTERFEEFPAVYLFLLHFFLAFRRFCGANGLRHKWR